MSDFMSDLEAPDLVAPRLSAVTPCYDKAEVCAALRQSIVNRAVPDFVWVALPGVQMERWIIENQDWKTPRVRHRWLP
jgi:hypothetical protein